jgi:mannose-6-phosphate isomerase-like protein (cupin superfamily)
MAYAGRKEELWIARRRLCRRPRPSPCRERRGRSTEVFVDGDLEVRFAARPTNGPQVPHQRDELYFVAAGTGRYRVEDKVTAVGPGDVLFCAARVAHEFEDISPDFSVRVLFYGPQK